VPAGAPVEIAAGNVGYSRSGPYHENRARRVTDDPIGDAPRENPAYSPRPQLPTTIRYAPSSSASATISSAGRSPLKWAPATVPPASSTFLTYSSSNSRDMYDLALPGAP
jgi:hypothetical protein